MVETSEMTWDRKEIVSRDDRGASVTASSAGFPRKVKGNWQPRARRAEGAPGLSVAIEGVLYTKSFGGGRIGDIVTDGDGNAFKVVAKTKRGESRESSVFYYAYSLETMKAGSEQS